MGKFLKLFENHSDYEEYKDFFDLNTDLADRKEELIELAEKMFN